MVATAASERLKARRTSDSDPLAVVMNLGVAGAGVTALAASATVHAVIVRPLFSAWVLTALLGWQDSMQGRIRARMDSEYVLDVEPEAKPPEPPKAEEPEQPKEAAPPPKDTAKADKPEAAAPAAAQAGQILAAAPDPNEPVDFGNSFVQGTGDSYSGGKTDSKGTEKVAVRAIEAKGAGAPGPVGTAAVATVVKRDCARPTRLRGGSAWDCAFPPEADTDQIDQASATIEVTVNGAGRVESVRVVADPGHGFGRAARSCAMSKAFDAAIGDDCAPTTSTKSFRVNFNR